MGKPVIISDDDLSCLMNRRINKQLMSAAECLVPRYGGACACKHGDLNYWLL